MILLETERLRLRRFEPADIDRLVELDSTGGDEVHHLRAATPRERYEREIIPRWLSFQQSMPLLGYWAAVSRAGGDVLGWFHLRPDRFDADEQELGYRLRRDTWGQGLATEGGRALVAYGFERAGADKISARTLAANAARGASWRSAGSATSATSSIPRTSSPDARRPSVRR